MSAKERVKRPKMARTEPNRGWATLFEPPPAENVAAGAARAASTAPPADVISRSVELGYRVVDEYVRQGQRAAKVLSQPSTNPQAVIGDVQRIYADHLAQVARFWMDAFQIAAPMANMSGPLASMMPPMPGMAPAATAAPAPATGADVQPAPQPAPAEPARVRIEIAAQQPVTVSLDLRPAAGRQPLIVHALRAAEEDKPRIAGVTFHPASDDEPALLQVRVPAGQPAGIYSGLLVDAATNRPMGTLAIEVAADAKAG